MWSSSLCFILSCGVSYNPTEVFSPRDDGEGEEGSVAGGGHAQSVPAGGGAGSLHDHPDREPERDRLHLWSHCKFSMGPSVIPCVLDLISDTFALLKKHLVCSYQTISWTFWNK